jgi:DNA polymerase-3 subunit delta
MAKLHAIEYLAQPDKYPPKPVCVAFGDDLFLRRQVLLGLRHAVLGNDEGDFSLTSFEGRTAEFRDVINELTTMAMFGGQRLIVVESADEGAKTRSGTSASEGETPGEAADQPDGEGRGFVARYREQLEDYVAAPARSGILVLDVKSWPGNTRLAKAVNAHGLAVDCNSPSGGELTHWLGKWARQTYKCQLSASVADLLVEMIGPELGLLDQEFARQRQEHHARDGAKDGRGVARQDDLGHARFCPGREGTRGLAANRPVANLR